MQVWRSPFKAPPIALLGHSGGVRTARTSQDGRWIVSTGARDGTAKMWDAITGRVVANFIVKTIVDARLSADSHWLFTRSSDGIGRIWSTIDLGSQILLAGLPNASRSLVAEEEDAAAIAPDGKYLLAIGGDNVARVWETASGNLKATLGDQDQRA